MESIGFSEKIRKNLIHHVKNDEDVDNLIYKRVQTCINNIVWRPRFNIYLINFLLIVLKLTPILGSINPEMFCTMNERRHLINPESICELHWLPNQNFPELSKVNDIMILNKLHHEVSGVGFKCTVERIDINCSKGFFGQENCLYSDWKPIKLSEQECREMVKTQRCKIETPEYVFNKAMKCGINGCVFYEYPEPKFNWLETNYIHGYKCSVVPKSIIAENKKSKLFLEDDCNASQLFCQTGNSMLVWNETVYHQCPFEAIKVSKNFSFEENFLINYEDNILLEPKYKEFYCNSTLYKTNQGVYVTKKSFFNYKGYIMVAEASSNIAKNLIISNIDLNKREELKWVRKMQMDNCLNFMLNLQIFSRLDKEYIRFKNFKNNEIILYVENGRVYLTECYPIASLSIYEVVKKCFKQIPVIVNLGLVSYSAFLNANGIVSLVGTEVHCSIRSDIIFLNVYQYEEPIVFQRIGDKIIKTNSEKLDWITISPFDLNWKPMYTHHPEILLSNIDEIKEISEIIENKIEDKTFFTRPIPDDLAKGTAERFIENIKTNILKPFKVLYNYINLVVTIILGLIIFILYGYFLYKTRCCFLRKKLSFKEHIAKNKRKEKDGSEEKKEFIEKNSLNK